MIFRIARRHALAAVLPLLLAGCASLAPPSAEQIPASSVAAHSFHETIALGGRMSVRYQGTTREEALHGSFSWAQTPAQTTVTLLSPLGQTIAVIDVTPRGATLIQNGRPTRAAADVDMLTARELGWPLPVAGLREWLQGFAIDSAGHRFIATPQASDVTTRDGWHIRYANWQDDAGNRPKRIDLARATEQAGDVSIRIVIDSWQEH